jgi:spore coat protein CotH
MKRILMVTGLVLAMAFMAFSQRGGRGAGGPGSQQEIKLVERFAKNKGKLLTSEERKAALAYLESQGLSGGGFGGRGGRMGGFSGRGDMAAGAVEKGRALSPKDVTAYPDAPLFDPTAFRTLFLTFEDADWEHQMMAFKNTDVDVPATLVVDGKTFKDVGAHFHGMSSFMMVPEGQKHSINLKLDAVYTEQQIGGQRTLILLNSAQDPSYLRSVLFLQAARDFLPASKANYARVVINGESWGAYVNMQFYDKEFINDWFKTAEGARWKVPGSPNGRGGLEYLGADPALYKQRYAIKSKDDPKAWADLANLCKILNETPSDQLEAALTRVLDVDNALRFLALDNTLVNDDGYWTRASDYDIYEDEKGIFHVFPWDTNETFSGDSGGGGGRGGGRGRGGPGGRGGFDPMGGGPPQDFGGGPGGMMQGNATLDPLIGMNDSTKPLRSKLLAVPALRAKYLDYVRQIATKWLDWKTLSPLATKYQELIADDVKADTHKLYTYEAFQSAVPSLKSFADTRRAYLLNYVDKLKIP